ncbi:Sec23-binding domain of Sec16-domain-containing protein, partial [Halteromyces radiatus]|uniref:Sec23-binding domain of Sec16-domain-containing protein n=1 Tax=Halteromyces radiatus TaxID=101107 RepID=UPI00221FABDC
GQWVQFDPMVHYYYDEQGQYHYYDPNTGQEYDYTQYAYQNNYDPQQQYDNTSSGAQPENNQSAGSTSTPDFYNLTGSRTATPQLPVESTIICLNPSCQSVNKATSKFCEECGTPFITNGSRAQTPAIPTVPTSPPAVVSAASTSTMYDPSSYQPTTQPPVDQDPLQRYKRRPLVRFGFGGKLCVMFPQTIHQQYGGGYDIGMSAKKTSSTIQIKNISEILDGTSTQMACLQSFIGPVLSDPDYSVKNKKKQVITYMNNRITELETSSTMTNSTLDVGTRLLLWKLVKFMIEHDGSIGDSDESNKALLDLLQPQTKLTTADMNNFSVPAYGNIIQNQEDQQGQDLSEITLDKLQDYLARGDRRGAVAYAMQQDLWSHALIISSCVDRELWQAVVRGFSQRELAVTANSKQERIHHHMEGNRQGLRVLYALFSGMGASSSKYKIAKKKKKKKKKVHSPLQIGQLDKWQETLGLILANRTTKDFEAITALGDIMKNHGWLNAAHICYLLSPQSSLLSGSDTPYVRYTLLGTMDEQKALMDVDSYLLTELAEFAISLRPGIGNSKCLPHLQGYKLMHAWWLVDIGLVKEASRYCSAINQCIKDYTKESPYLHQHLVAKVKELTDLCNEYHGNRSIG